MDNPNEPVSVTKAEVINFKQDLVNIRKNKFRNLEEMYQ